jgi:hypothetical protein
MLRWADENISKPKVQACGQNAGAPPMGVPSGAPSFKPDRAAGGRADALELKPSERE